MLYVVSYFGIIVPFCMLDAVWLSVMGKRLYQPTLGDILLPSPYIPPAIAFYVMFPLGILIFGVLPGLKAGSVSQAAVYAALYGALAYATYDLTNFATLRNWTLQITLLDVVWGAFASAVAAVVAYYATRAIVS